MQLVIRTVNLMITRKAMLQTCWAPSFSQKYRKTSFDWQPLQQKKPPNNQNYRNQNTYHRNNPDQNTQRKNNPNHQNTYQRNNLYPNEGSFQKKKTSNYAQDQINEQMPAQIEQNDAQVTEGSFALSPNLSLLGQINNLKSVTKICRFYEQHHQLYSPRIIAKSARQFGSLLDKEKNLSTLKSQQQVLMIQKHIGQVLDNILPKLRTEEIQKQQVKNLLYFIKKILNDHGSLIHIQPDTDYFNDRLYKKVLQFRDKILMIFLDKSLDYSYYETHELIEIHYELTKFSQFFEVEQIYKCILERQKLIEETVNSQFLFSATTFLANVKRIQSSLQKLSYQNNHQRNQQKSPLVVSYQKTKTNEDLTRITHLREKCYEIFFKKLIFYFEDLNQFIKFTDVVKIWHSIILCNSGIRMLIKENNGPLILQSISKIIVRNNSKIDELINGHQKVLSNSLITFFLVSRKQPQDNLLKELVEKTKNLGSPFSMIEKNRLKMKMKTLASDLRQDKIINVNDEMDTIQFINSY